MTNFFFLFAFVARPLQLPFLSNGEHLYHFEISAIAYNLSKHHIIV